VFVSYAQADKHIARQVAETLKNAGLRVWIDEWELAAGDSIAARIEEAVASSDILLVLLSPRSVESRWVQSELNAALSRELRDRAITVVPALIEDCVIPPLLADRQFLDLRTDWSHALRRLVDQIGSAPDVDFSRLDSTSFERLVADLLDKLGFVVQPIRRSHDGGVDIIASYRSRDPFGAEYTDTWLVETKLYREQRVSVAALEQMRSMLFHAGVGNKGLIVTNSRLTSVARDFLEDSSNRSAHELRVVDGTELANLLIQHPDLIRTYFPAVGSNG
jgi:hypothetical protein